MARPHPTSASEHRPTMASSASFPVLLHAAWVAAVVAVYLALCTIHSRKPSSLRRRASRSASSSSNRRGSRDDSSRGGTAAAGAATPAAEVSSTTPGDTAAANNVAGVETAGTCSPVTVIEVGTHGPIAPAFLPPPPDPVPPRRSLSLSAKHIRFAERLGRIRSMQRGGAGEGSAAAAEDDVFVGCRRGGGEVGEEGTLWTKTIILGERCGVPAAGDGGELDEYGDKAGTVPLRSYRPRQQRSLPVTRSNSFAGVGSAGARRLADPRF